MKRAAAKVAKVVIVATAKNCSSCADFKRLYMNGTIKLLENNGAHVVTVEYSRVGAQPPIKFKRGKELTKFIMWFPVIIMLDKKIYDDKRIPLTWSNVSIYGLVTEGGVRKPNNRISYLPSSIISWYNLQESSEKKIKVPTREEMKRRGVPKLNSTFSL